MPVFVTTRPRRPSLSTHEPAANTAASITVTPARNSRVVIKKIVWSYTAAPTNGRLFIEVDGSTVFSIYITGAGPGPLNMDTQFAIGAAVTITLSAGGGVVAGSLNVEHYETSGSAEEGVA